MRRVQAFVADELECGALRAQRRREAKEEEVVAEALLGMHRDAVASFAAKERRILPFLRAEGVFPPRLVEASGDEEREREIEVRSRIGGAQRDRRAIVALGLGVTPALVMQRAHVVVRGGERGIERERAAQAFEGLVVLAYAVLRDAEVHERDRVARLELERAGEVRQCLIEAAPIDLDQAQHVPGAGERGLQRDRLADHALRLVEPADALQRCGEVRPRVGHARPGGDRHTEVRERAGPVVGARAGFARLHVRMRVGERGIGSRVGVLH